jgi:hypothetical protein
VAGTLAAARDAYRRRDWAAARERFLAVRAAGGLGAADLDTLGDDAWWLGEVDEASAALEAACRRHLEEGRPGPAAIAAIGVGSLRAGPTGRSPRRWSSATRRWPGTCRTSSPSSARLQHLQERYVREWSGGMASGGIVDYDPATASFSLPDEHAACLTGAGSANLAPRAASTPTWPGTSTPWRGRSGRAEACPMPPTGPSSPT